MQQWSSDGGSLSFATLRALYRSRHASPSEVIRAVYARIRASAFPEAWITLVDEQSALAAAAKIEHRALQHFGPDLPLYGIPFAVKDNIDVQSLPTTAGCKDFSHLPPASATVVTRLQQAGAILIGKTNLDQFATGLTGVVSSYGPSRNPISPAHVSGGSSAGSAVAVSSGLVSFSLGTDTAGSGRVPAAFTNIVGLKPTRGLVSTRGVLPACRSLDCVSVFALTAGDAAEVLSVAQGYDPADEFSRIESDTAESSMLRVPVTSFRFGVAPDHAFPDASPESLALYKAAAARLESFGGKRFEIDFTPLRDTARLLYEGPWIAERYVAIGDFLKTHPDSVDLSTRNAVLAAESISAADAFRATYKLETLRRVVARMWSQIDVLLLPTALEVPTIAESLADPRGVSARLGRLTNFVNLLDLCAISIPAGTLPGALPFGITLLGPAFTDSSVIDLGDRFQRARPSTLGATNHPYPPPEETRPTYLNDAPSSTREKVIPLAVVGAHLSGQPLNYQLTQLGARLIRRCKTAPQYRLFALETTPAKPGLVRQLSEESPKGSTIDVEVWEISETSFGAFMRNVGTPLCIGTIILDTGETVKGFLCETAATAKARDITHFGGWLNYLARRAEAVHK